MRTSFLMLRRCSILIFGAICASPAVHGASGDSVTTLARKIYAETVNGAAARRFASATILYLDAKIMTRVAVTPESLEKLGCRVEIPNDSPKWADLVAILLAEDVRETDRSSAEVRWGIIFWNNGQRVNEVYFGPYYGPQSEGARVFGYVDKVAVSFSAPLPKKMGSYIEGTNCH
jgi:hypothetical protein